MDVETAAAGPADVAPEHRWVRLPRRTAPLLLVLVAAAVAFAAVAFASSGVSVLVVESPSMGRAAPVGTLVVSQRAPFASIHVGDVVTYRAPDSNRSVTHRVVERTPGGLRVRGDINGAPDAWTVRPTMMVGRAIALLPVVGWLVRLAPWLMIGVVAVSCLTLPLSSPTIRTGLRVVGTCILLSVVATVQRPLIAWDVLTQTASGGRVDAAIVGTGLLPVRFTAADGTTVAAGPGQVVHLLLAPDRIGRISFDATLALGWTGWGGVVLVCLVPLLAVLAVGLPGPAAELKR